MQRTIEYFEESGQANTERTLALACQRARQAGIGSIVLASTRGYTAGRALESCSGLNLIAVGIGRDRDRLAGSILVTEKKDRRAYFGMLTIDPVLWWWAMLLGFAAEKAPLTGPDRGSGAALRSIFWKSGSCLFFTRS